ncbi:MAG: hypothetical protein A2Z99_16650 [Treponema sp. GWB1_62_6]|nr:MAG: hypothetical protein A2Y36_17605 [Treponema sp. GWA1_62_8]OHE67079.1 MAG: hypothetical protein A2001_02490 [Treponema sp. GWC1_61_84]OHE67334.1 MAG: hypothetical protein A2Z99_16650 [Treponema sp. GWB1_62_6]OHE75241.1 MAG: hypothetical protein A2413_00175 [Treponema sp. RIFOXYC1_FULL_61_9]HCM26213.1 anti-sigma factor antagonist [Treponema sp.]
MKIESVEGIKIAVPEDEHLDASNRELFKSQLEAVASSSRTERIILDLSGVRFIDSSGLGVIMTVLKGLRASGSDMVACGISKPVRVLFDMVRLDRVMSTFPTRAEALFSLLRNKAE